MVRRWILTLALMSWLMEQVHLHLWASEPFVMSSHTAWASLTFMIKAAKVISEWMRGICWTTETITATDSVLQDIPVMKNGFADGRNLLFSRPLVMWII